MTRVLKSKLLGGGPVTAAVRPLKEQRSFSKGIDMNNPYAPTVNPSVNPEWKSQFAFDLGRYAVLLVIWLAVSYVVSLPASKLFTKDSTLIAMSPFIPIGLLSTAIAGETIWALLMTIFAFPITISVTVGLLGVRRKRACVAAISLGILYGLFLRLFYLICDVA
jgi:hypothetical protein